MDNFKGSQAFYKKFSKKFKFSIKDINPNSQIILSAGNFNRYLELSSYQELINISEKYGQDNCFCESRQNSKMVNLFFDFDCKDDPHTNSQVNQIIKSLKSKIQSFFPQLNIQFYVKESNEYSGRINSMHIVCHLSTADGYSIYFDYPQSCSQVKHFVSKLNLEHPFDHKQAYSGHLLRLIHSNKFNKDGSLADRILDRSIFYSDFTDPLKSLTSYCPNEKYMLVSDYVNKHFILQFVKGHEYTKNYLFEHIIQRPNESHLSLTLTEQRTPLCEHKSNNAVCMFYHRDPNPNIIIKCQDTECGKFVQTFFRYDDNNHRCEIITTGDNSSDRQQQSDSDQPQSSNSVSATKNKKSNDPIKKNAQSVVLGISQEATQDSGYIIDNVDHIEQNGYSAEGSPPQNNLFKGILGTQKCSFIGKDGHHYYTINGVVYKSKFSKNFSKDLKSLPRRLDREELLNLGVVFNQFVLYNNCNNTTNINIQQTKEDPVYDDAFDEVEFPSELHKEYFISIINDDFQFVTEIYNLDFPNEFIYVYDEHERGSVMFFDDSDDSGKIKTNGGCWTTSGGLKFAKQKVRNHVVKFLNSIIRQFGPKDPRRKVAQFKLKSVRAVFKNNTEFDQYLMETYFNKRIKFNKNPHYLHFQNGTFDLEKRKLIKTVPEMYNTFQIKYDYDQSVSYDDVYQQLSQIMQKNEFQWLLKQFSNCLNPNKVIEEKQIVILTGKGHNGKTQLFNLVNETLDLDAYSINGRSQMLQSPNTSSNSATPDTAKLIYKRFCYVAELDKKLSFNQQQVKILTGGEKIQTRDLFKSLITFQPYSGIFISCNQVPNIDTTDGGFMNRLRIIDVKNQFVQDPKHQFQKSVNKQLPCLIETTQWKQAFMNILIDYYYKPSIPLPKSIQKSIDLRVNLQQNPIHDWAQDNLIFKINDFILSENLFQKYIEDTDSQIKKQAFNKQINSYIQQSPEIFQDVDYKKIDKKNSLGEREQGYGFTNCSFKQQ